MHSVDEQACSKWGEGTLSQSRWTRTGYLRKSPLGAEMQEQALSHHVRASTVEKPGSLTSSSSTTCDGLTPTLLQSHTKENPRGTGQVSRGHRAAQTEACT